MKPCKLCKITYTTSDIYACSHCDYTKVKDKLKKLRKRFKNLNTKYKNETIRHNN